MKRRVIVVGGGPAGMMSAITAAKEGAEVTILEHNDRIGKKILSTGNGRCNFTNEYQSPSEYRSDEQSFPWKVVSQFPYEETLRFFEELGIMGKKKNGGLYPFSEQASAVLDVLRMEVERRRIMVYTGVNVLEIKAVRNGFRVIAVSKEQGRKTFGGDALILAAGSKAASKLGSDGSGYSLAKSMGHSMIPVVPALVQLECCENFYKALAGVRVYGKVMLLIDGKEAATDTGEIQLTDYGISGIPVFQVSRFAARGLYEKRRVKAVMDFMPDFSEKAFADYIGKRIAEKPDKKMELFLVGVFHKKLAQVFLKVAKIKPDKEAGMLTKDERERLIQTVKRFQTEIKATKSFEQAQICAGGVNTKEIYAANMESRLVNGLFFAGELVDVDGICGGYNLQWAWSSGYVAGKGAANV